MVLDLELIGVGKSYDSGQPAVADFDLQIERGEFVAFLGPSGCGKTTTLRMIAGFEAITRGDLLIRGRRFNDVPAEKRPTSMIFQNYALFPHMSVRRNVAFGLEAKGIAKAQRDDKVDRLLHKLGLSDVADQSIHRLSGGQRQRIALARGLVVEPQILLLDEPLGALDANLRKTIQAELKLLQRNLGITFVFVTHAQSEALTMSDRIVVMNRGRVEQIATPYQLYTRPSTPFVASFIGRNTIVEGRIAGRNDRLARVATAFGTFSAVCEGDLPTGSEARLVVPAEAFELTPGGAADSAVLTSTYDGNVVAGRIVRRSSVGHLVQMVVDIGGSSQVEVEGHAEIYDQDRFAASPEVLLCWRASEASVIAA